MRITAPISGFICLSIFSTACVAQNFAIGGMHIGSTISEARAAIKSTNPQIIIKDLKIANGTVVGFEGREQISTGMESAGARSLKPDAMVERFIEKDHVVVLSNEKGLVWFLGRTQGYAPDTPRPTYATTWAALEEKFGEPSRKSGSIPIGSGEWEFDRSGKLFSRKSNLASANGPCTRSGRGTDFTPGPGGYYPINAPEAFSPNCGVRADAKIDASKSSYNTNDEGLVKFISVTVYDSAVMYEALKRAQDQDNAARQKEQRETLEKAKGVKPKL